MTTERDPELEISMRIPITSPWAVRGVLALSAALAVIIACGQDANLGRVLSPTRDAQRDEHSAKTPKELWVTSQGSNILFIRNFEDLSPIAQINLPAGTGPHIITFHTPDFAYVGGMTDGNVYVIDANARQVVQTLKVAPTLAHQVKVSPDGQTALVAIIGSKKLTKLLVDEANRSWSIDASLDVGAATGKAPVCTVFRADGQRAFISLNPSGIAIVDVPTMSYVGQIATDGFIACGMIKQDADHVVIASTGGGGHIYTLDMTTETLTDRGVLGAASWHSFNMTADGTRGFGSSPFSDEVIIIDLTTTPVTNLGSIRFDQVPGVGNNQPDAFGGGEVISGNVLPVGLRAAGNVAIVNAHNLEVRTLVNLAAPAPFNPMTCGPVGPPTDPGGCAIHGVTPRPR
jgi:DNA-binding beta-propeller fold protein YncE